jgi:hypothetical protein
MGLLVKMSKRSVQQGRAPRNKRPKTNTQAKRDLALSQSSLSQMKSMYNRDCGHFDSNTAKVKMVLGWSLLSKLHAKISRQM